MKLLIICDKNNKQKSKWDKLLKKKDSIFSTALEVWLFEIINETDFKLSASLHFLIFY